MQLKKASPTSGRSRGLPRYSEGKELTIDGVTYIVRGYAHSKTVPNAYLRLEAPDGTITEKARNWVAHVLQEERREETTP